MSDNQTVSDRAAFVRSQLESLVSIHNVTVGEVQGVWDGEVVAAPVNEENLDVILQLAEDALAPEYHVYDSEIRTTDDVEEFVLYFNNEDATPLASPTAAPQVEVPALGADDLAQLEELKAAIAALTPQAKAEAFKQGILQPVAQSQAPKATSKRAAAATPKMCLCGCGKQTRGGTFIPGHDATLKGRLQRAMTGKLRQDELSFKVTPEIESHIRSNPLWDGWFGQWLNAQKLAAQ